MKYIYLFVAALFLLSSCSEDTTSSPNSTNAKPYLEVRPESITVDQYDFFEIDYRVANFPYESRVEILLNEGSVDSSLGMTITGKSYFYYTKPGDHTLTLSAYDSFADTLLATKSIPITVIPFQPTVSITPTDLDTTSNNPSIVIQFSAKSNLYDDFLREYYWSLYRDTTYVKSGSGWDWPVNFNESGTYIVKVSMIDYHGRGVMATDSTAVTVKLN